MRRFALFWLAALITGCASSPDVSYTPPMRQYHGTVSKAQVYDPLEPVNRRVYKFNAQFDDYVFIPVVNGYRAIVPDYVDQRISSFLSNIGEFRNATNATLQAKPILVLNDIGRFGINTTVGLLGLYDPATHLGLKQQKDDFGKTLAVWGIGTGSYVVLPVLGPSNVRDTVGMVGDALAFSFALPSHIESSAAYNATQYGLRPVNTRANNDFRYHESGSPFEYEIIRAVTTKMRNMEVEN